MRRILAVLSLLVLCLFCHCKKPAPPDEARVARGAAASIMREHKSL